MGGQYLVSTYGADEGLPQSSVMGVTQTPDGYLWIGTLMGGVSRFDGLRFVNFDLEETKGQGPTQVNHLFTDAAGRLWVNTFFGLWRYDAGQFVPELPKEMSSDLRLNMLAYSTRNEVWFTTLQTNMLRGVLGTNGTWSWDFVALPGAATNNCCRVDQEQSIWYLRGDNRLGRLKAGRLEILGTKSGLPGGRLTVLALDQHGKLWVGSDIGLAIWQKNHFVSMVPTNGPAHVYAARIFAEGRESLWVAGDSKLRRLAGRKWVAEAQSPGQIPGWNISIDSVTSDGADGLWINSSQMGLLHVDQQGQVERISTAEGLPSNLLRFLFRDREGNLWTGHDRGGLVGIRKRLFYTISKAEGLADTVVSSVCEDAQGVVWIGTVGGTLGRWQNGYCTNLTLPKRGRYCHNAVVYPDREGRLWVGTEGNGVFTYEHDEFQPVPLDLGIGTVRMIFEDHAGRVWIGTKDSLYYLEQGKWTLARSQGSDWSDFLAGMAETADGTLWVGVDGGYLLRYEGKEFKTLPLPDSIPASRLWTLWPAEGGGLWIGTYASGLLKVNGDKFEQYFRHPGSRWSRVTEGLTDDEGNLWLGTRSGIERITKAALGNWESWKDQATQRHVYGRSDGLLTIGTSVEFQPRCWKGHDGRLWFGMANGVAYVNPKDVRANLVPPMVVVEEVRVDGESVPQSLWSSDSAPVVLTVPPGRHDLEIRFTAPTMVAPETIRMRYRLRGLNDSWTSAGLQRKVVYQALPPGRYIFEADALNRDGVPSNFPGTLAVTVLPHFWETKWFLPGVMIVLAGITGVGVTLAVRRRYRLRLQAAAQQRALELERTRICRDLHDELGVGLTEIGLLGDLASRQDTGHDKKFSEEISSRARDLAGSLDEIVWAINPTKDNSAALTDYFIRYAQNLLGSAGLRCRLETNSDGPEGLFDANVRHQLFLAFKEALNNVIIHADATEVRIRMGVEAGRWLISVEDNGCGFDKPTIQGSPDGLVGMRERLAKLGGQCEIKSTPQQGTTVTFLLPIKLSSKN